MLSDLRGGLVRRSRHGEGSGAARLPKPYHGLPTATAPWLLRKSKDAGRPRLSCEEGVQAHAAGRAGAHRPATAVLPHQQSQCPVLFLSDSDTSRPEATLVGRGLCREGAREPSELGSSRGSEVHLYRPLGPQ